MGIHDKGFSATPSQSSRHRVIASGRLCWLAAGAVLSLAACTMDMPTPASIRDAGIFNRRITETPRQRVIRECQQEATRFRVACAYCHTTEKIEEIQQPDKLHLNPTGIRAHIMRTSPAFGLNQDCVNCHQSKFALTRAAERQFGPGTPKGLSTETEPKEGK